MPIISDISKINADFLNETFDLQQAFPNYYDLTQSNISFQIDFGLKELPTESGLIVIRGARQFGKSTWLEGQATLTYRTFGPGSCFYLNGDSIKDEEHLIEEISNLVPLFSKSIRRIFIDEITSVDKWEQALKRLWDSGITRKCLIITTGSNANDLRRGTERLPGRKGRLDRTDYIFTPISYLEFKRLGQTKFADKTWMAYLISGGSPLACRELIQNDRIPEFVIQLVRDWLIGAVAKAGKQRSLMLGVIEQITTRGGTPISMTRLAKETGMANNSVALSYVELLQDLLITHRCYFTELNRFGAVPRKESKVPFVNLLALSCLQRTPVRTVSDFESLSEQEQGKWVEWLVAQELWRRSAKKTGEVDSQLMYWQNEKHEIDFVTEENCYEVKRGKTAASEFGWFLKSFPKRSLIVVSGSEYDAGFVKGIAIERFLSET